MDYVITANNNQGIHKDRAYKDSVVTYQFDFSPWAEDNNSVSTVTWTSKSGQASISGEALASNVATAQVTFSEAGGNLIQVKADTGTEIYTAHLDILVKDPSRLATNDYGLCEC